MLCNDCAVDHYLWHYLLYIILTAYHSINQGDIPERGQQVKQMRRIFESAKTVWIWLGIDNPPASQANLAVSTIKKMSDFLCEKLSITYDDLDDRNIWYELTTTSRHLVPTPDKSPFSSPEVWDALVWFFKQPYFTRV